MHITIELPEAEALRVRDQFENDPGKPLKITGAMSVAIVEEVFELETLFWSERIPDVGGERWSAFLDESTCKKALQPLVEVFNAERGLSITEDECYVLTRLRFKRCVTSMSFTEIAGHCVKIAGFVRMCTFPELVALHANVSKNGEVLTDRHPGYSIHSFGKLGKCYGFKKATGQALITGHVSPWMPVVVNGKVYRDSL